MPAPQSFSDVFRNYDATEAFRTVCDLADVVFTWRNELHGDISDAERDWDRSPGGLEEMAAEAFTTGLYYSAAYRDAAAALAFIGVMAPFVEGFLVKAFEYLGKLHGGVPSSEHPRCKYPPSEFWCPKGRRKALLKHVDELRDVVGLRDWLQDEILDAMDTLFYIRNQSLHHAFDWPQEKLDALMGNKDCSDGGKPELQRHRARMSASWSREQAWIVYPKDKFLQELLEVTARLLEGFVEVARDHGGSFCFHHGGGPVRGSEDR